MSENDTPEVPAEVTTPSHKLQIREVCKSGWSLSYPDWVRETFAKGLQTDVLPPYVIGHFNSALAAARAINRKLEKDARIAEEAAKKASGKAGNYNARKAERRARDREFRNSVKGHNPSAAKYGK